MKITTRTNPFVKLVNSNRKPMKEIQLNQDEIKTLKKAHQILLRADALYEEIYPFVDDRDNPYLRAWIELSYCYPGGRD